jgi:hypothetical protein
MTQTGMLCYQQSTPSTVPIPWKASPGVLSASETWSIEPETHAHPCCSQRDDFQSLATAVGTAYRGRMAALRRVAAIALVAMLTVSCTVSDPSGATPNGNLSGRCQQLFDEVKDAKEAWAAAEGTDNERRLHARWQTAQDTLFASGCLAS